MKLTLTSNKKAVSLIVAYVLLIVIAMALSVIVYNWLRWYMQPGTETECPEELSLIIKDYNYSCYYNSLNITVKNKGLFVIDGYIVRVNNKPDSKIGVYKLDEQEIELEPGDEINEAYYTNETMDGDLITGYLDFVEIQPYLFEKGNKIFCKQIAKQTLECAA